MLCMTNAALKYVDGWATRGVDGASVCVLNVCPADGPADTALSIAVVAADRKITRAKL